MAIAPALAAADDGVEYAQLAGLANQRHAAALLLGRVVAPGGMQQGHVGIKGAHAAAFPRRVVAESAVGDGHRGIVQLQPSALVGLVVKETAGVNVHFSTGEIHSAAILFGSVAMQVAAADIQRIVAPGADEIDAAAMAELGFVAGDLAVLERDVAVIAVDGAARVVGIAVQHFDGVQGHDAVEGIDAAAGRFAVAILQRHANERQVAGVDIENPIFVGAGNGVGFALDGDLGGDGGQRRAQGQAARQGQGIGAIPGRAAMDGCVAVGSLDGVGQVAGHAVHRDVGSQDPRL